MRNHSYRAENSTLPSIGQRVLSTGGRQLGVVVQVRPDCFHLAMDDDDVWISRDAVFTVDDGHVTLICEHERLSAYTVIPVGRRTLAG